MASRHSHRSIGSSEGRDQADSIDFLFASDDIDRALSNLDTPISHDIAIEKTGCQIEVSNGKMGFMVFFKSNIRNTVTNIDEPKVSGVPRKCVGEVSS